MSARLMARVWELDLPQNHAWVLMSLCDHAEHDGTRVFPGNGYTAWKTGLSVSTVKRVLKDLENRYGLVELVEEGGGARASEWRVLVENFGRHRKAPPAPRGRPQNAVNPVQEEPGLNGKPGPGSKPGPGTEKPGPENRGQSKPGLNEEKPGSRSRARVHGNRHKETSPSPTGAGRAPAADEKPAKAITSLTVERTREVGFDAAPHQRANWGRGWAAFVYRNPGEGREPPSAERQHAVLWEIVAAAAGRGGRPRYFLAVEDAVKRVEGGPGGRPGGDNVRPFRGRGDSIAVIGATDEDYREEDYRFHA